MKNCSIQEEIDNEKDEKQEGIREGPKQAQYKRSLYLMLKINMLFQTNRTTKRES